ncbi:LysR family transcriptional regulator [Mycobacterium sp. KBS0706]|uniref:LysR substrate-binding domain-containing protein n=1 Tax=Mycobacterium sp. KBS0706 TaxID=2578109 RepID=UPI00110FD70E|nr:LysR substrate-binding domain-containing protein [Mycobacterium sp. KBS0706]TSD83492.1 LysR family transcriptional regulator [Mycobacterium sp. KBS0706]
MATSLNFRFIRHLWLFLAVAEEEHFGRAAERLGMSQPPLTEQIQALEQALGVRLFERNRRGTKLTPIGAAILPAVRKFADQLERLDLAVREAIAGQTGVLNIGAITSAMLGELPLLLRRLRLDHPGLTVSVREIDSVDAVPALETGELDLAFARLEGNLGPNIRSLPVAQDRLAVALQRDHPMATLPRIELASLANEDFVMFSRQVSPLSFDSMTAACRSHGFSPRILHHVRSAASQIAFVSWGQGVALVPSAFRKIAPENVVLRPLKEKVTVVTAAVAWNAARPNPIVEAAVALIGGGILPAAGPT